MASDSSFCHPEARSAEGSHFDPVAYINEPRWQTVKPGLERIRALLERMGNPQNDLRFIHVAGTNGKGSVCANLASILEQAGYTVGLFTSPYIMEFEERIRVNGCNIPAADLLDVTCMVRTCAEQVECDLGEHPTEFELMAAVAFEHFKRAQCDIVVLEVGLGGALDATNIIPAPLVAVICSIGLDHTALLGDTLTEIAQEKAGIIKPGSRVVAYPPESEEVRNVICAATAEAGDPLIFADFASLEIEPIRDGSRIFRYKGEEYATHLLGAYQPKNAALALEATDALEQCGFTITAQEKQEGIAATTWLGRFTVFENAGQSYIIDGGHNPQGARALVESIQDAFLGTRPVFVMGVLADKPYEQMLQEILPFASGLVCTTPPSPRALEATKLAEVAKRLTQTDIPIVCTTNAQEALDKAKDIAERNAPICVTGSLYSLKDYLELIADMQKK